MAKKFHISTSGKAVVCKADERACPRGGSATHFQDPQEAELFYSRVLAEKPYGANSLESPEAAAQATAELQRLVQEGDWRKVQEFVEGRVGSPLHQEFLARSAELGAKLDTLDEKLAQYGKLQRSRDPEKALEGAILHREATMAYRDVYEELAELKKQSDNYRALTAQGAYAASTMRRNEERLNGTLNIYDRDTLRDLEALGDYPPNSPEWHALRNNGIGGSDMGIITGAVGKGAYKNPYDEIFEYKTGDRESKPNPMMDGEDLTSAIGRGNAWEDNIRYQYQDRHPELRVGYCKTSWGSKTEPYRHANFDGVLLDKDGNVEGIVEIKTGSNPKIWGPEEDGFDAVPPGYRKQALWYAANAGVKKGTVVVLLNDTEMREYSFSTDDPKIKAEIEEMNGQAKEFWGKVEARREVLKSGFSKPLEKTETLTTRDSVPKIAGILSAYGDMPPKQAMAKLYAEVDKVKAETGKEELDQESYQTAVNRAFSKVDPTKRKSPLVGIDLETSSLSPKTGRIIETGIVSLSPSGETEVVYSSLHGIPERAKRGLGVGATSIHRITPEHVEGKRDFQDPVVQKEVLEALKGKTMVAHNAAYEDRWLSANLKGFVEAKASGEIKILDTREVARVLIPKSHDNSLNCFTEINGVPYAAAHAATQDTDMMMKALHRTQKTINKRGRFVSKRATAKDRLEADQESKVLTGGR